MINFKPNPAYINYIYIYMRILYIYIYHIISCHVILYYIILYYNILYYNYNIIIYIYILYIMIYYIYQHCALSFQPLLCIGHLAFPKINKSADLVCGWLGPQTLEVCQHWLIFDDDFWNARHSPVDLFKNLQPSGFVPERLCMLFANAWGIDFTWLSLCIGHSL